MRSPLNANCVADETDCKLLYRGDKHPGGGLGPGPACQALAGTSALHAGMPHSIVSK